MGHGGLVPRLECGHHFDTGTNTPQKKTQKLAPTPPEEPPNTSPQNPPNPSPAQKPSRKKPEKPALTRGKTPNYTFIIRPQILLIPPPKKKKKRRKQHPKTPAPPPPNKKQTGTPLKKNNNKQTRKTPQKPPRAALVGTWDALEPKQKPHISANPSTNLGSPQQATGDSTFMTQKRRRFRPCPGLREGGICKGTRGGCSDRGCPPPQHERFFLVTFV